MPELRKLVPAYVPASPHPNPLSEGEGDLAADHEYTVPDTVPVHHPPRTLTCPFGLKEKSFVTRTFSIVCFVWLSIDR